MACIVLFSACGGKKEDKIAMPENPQQAYTDLMQQNSDIWSETLKDLFPAIESPKKSETNLSAHFHANIAELAGELDVSIEAKAKTDATQPENPRMTSALDLAGKMTGAFAGEAKANLEMIVADAMVYARLKDLKLSIPQFATSEIMAPITPLLGKWYGDSFNTINEGMGKDFDLQKMFVRSSEGTEKIRDEILDILTSHNELTFVEMQGVENGKYVFSVKVDNKIVKEKMIRLAEVGGNMSDAEKEQMRADVDEQFKNTNITGTLRISPENPKYFSFEGKNTNTETNEEVSLVANIEENTKKITVLSFGGEYITLSIQQEGNKNIFSVSGGKSTAEEKTLLTGSMTDNSFDMKIFDETGEVTGNISLTKSGENWSGRLVLTDKTKGEVTINIEKLTFNTTSFELLFAVTQAENELGKGEISYALSEIDSVDIKAPAEHEPFGSLMEQFIPTMSIGSPTFVEPGTVPQITEEPKYEEYTVSQEEVEEKLKKLENMENGETPSTENSANAEEKTSKDTSSEEQSALAQ